MACAGDLEIEQMGDSVKTTVHRSISLQEGQHAYFLKLSAILADTVLGS